MNALNPANAALGVAVAAAAAAVVAVVVVVLVVVVVVVVVVCVCVCVCVVTIDPTGAIIAKHRKVHLFDIDVPGKITFKESDTLTAGDGPTTFDTPFGKVRNSAIVATRRNQEDCL